MLLTPHNIDVKIEHSFLIMKIKIHFKVLQADLKQIQCTQEFFFAIYLIGS